MSRVFSDKSVFFKICLAFSLLFVGTVILISIILYQYFHETVRSLVSDTVIESVSSRTDAFASALERVDVSIGLLNENDTIYGENDTSRPALCRLVMDYDGSKDPQDIFELKKDYDSALGLFTAYFSACFGEGSDSSCIFFVDSSYPVQGFLSGWGLDNSSSGLRSSREVSSMDWYRNAVEAEGETCWFTQPDQPDRLYLSKALKNRTFKSGMTIHEAFLGVLVVSFDISYLSDSFSIKGNVFEVSTALLEQSGGMVYCNNSDYRDFFTGTLNEDITPVELDGNECLYQKKTLSSGLSMVSLVSLQPLKEMARTSVRIIILIGSSALVVIVLLTFLLSKSIVKPIVVLSNHMKASDSNHIDCSDVGHDEVGTLYHEFNGLLDRLKKSSDETLEAEKKKNIAELHALQAQINPHFIYNTLNSVSCMAMLGGDEDIAAVVGNLSAIIRYSINQIDELVPVSKEMDILAQYRNIQKCCYHESLEIKFSVAPETLDCCIPKLLIQPLIENAIIHGGDIGGGFSQVWLDIDFAGDDLQIDVIDNGKTARTDVINDLATGRISSPEKNSLGVRNVYQRLKMVYPDKADLVFFQDSQNNTVARITVNKTVITRKEEEKNDKH